MQTLTFQASHSYSGSNTGIEVPVSLSVSGGRTVRLRAKVDTGASFCIFQRDYAEQLGIDLEAGTPERVATVMGSFEVFGHELALACLDWEFTTMVYFPASREMTRNVVGRIGWLQQFRLAIIDHDSMLWLSHYDD